MTPVVAEVERVITASAKRTSRPRQLIPVQASTGTSDRQQAYGVNSQTAIASKTFADGKSQNDNRQWLGRKDGVEV